MRYLTLLPLAVLFACSVETEDPQTKLNSLADSYVDKFLEVSPEYAYYIDMPIERHEDVSINRLNDLPAFETYEDSLYAELMKINEADLTEKKDKITFWKMRESLESSIGFRVCQFNLWNVSHRSGWFSMWNTIANFQPVETEDFKSQAITRWSKFPGYVDTEIENLKTGVSKGYTMPKEIVQLVIDQMEIFRNYEIMDSPFMSPGKRANDSTFQVQWQGLLESKVLPALLTYQNYLKDEYLPAAREEVSILNIPTGEACYQAFIRNYTTTQKTGHEIFEIGSEIVERNKADVVKVGKELYQSEDFKEIIDKVKEDPNDFYSSSEEILEANTKLLNQAKEVCKDWFATMPSTEVTLKPYEPHESGRGSYEAAKGDKPAYFRISLKDPETQKKGDNEVLTVHEAYPGHHLQVGIAKDIDGIHPISKFMFFGSYVEGWARYSEQLAEEMGLYAQQTSLIERRSWPSRGLVVDPGIHLKGWTKQQAIDFMMESGSSEDAALSLYHRIIIWPAQLTSYDMGGEEIKALRKMAEERLGDQFDIKQFHSKVLENGSIPLAALRSVITEWVESQENQ